MQVVRVISNSVNADALIRNLINKDGVELINRGVDDINKMSKVDVLVGPEDFESVEEILSQARAKFKILIPDVETAIDRMDNCHILTKRIDKSGYDFLKFFSCYHTTTEQHTHLDELVKAHPDKAETFSIGTSYKGRDLKAIRISDSVMNSKNKPMIWVDGGIHGREWVASSTALWIATALLGEVDSSLHQEVRQLLEIYQFVILPLSNPDGYEYSRSSKSNRLWRKTRRPSGCKYKIPLVKEKLCPKCYGIDPNRNFDVAFGTAGTTPEPCSETYPGSEAFSEENTKAMRDFIEKNSEIIKLYLSYHSYSQLFLKPLGYSVVLHPDEGIHNRAGDAYVDAVERTHGYQYESMVSMYLYPNSGSSADWAYKKRKIVNSYTVELRDEGKYMFFLPTEQIKPTGEENMRGFVALMNQLKY